MLKKKNVKLLIIAFLLFLLLSKFIYLANQREIEIKAMNNYYGYSTNSKYIGILEIPNISLKKGLFVIDSKYNNVDYNIQILDKSIMPDQDNSIVFLAAHSGNSNISYFNDIENLNIGNDVILYYNNKKYIYKITSCFLEKKTGIITVPNKINSLVLTTCSQKNKGYQYIVISELVDINE